MAVPAQSNLATDCYLSLFSGVVRAMVSFFNVDIAQYRPAARVWPTLFCVVAAIAPVLPHVVAAILPPAVTGCIALIIHVPLFAVLGRRCPPAAGVLAALGAAHGTALALFAAGWVWTFRELPLTVPAIAASIGGGLYAVVFIVAGGAVRAIRRSTLDGVGVTLAIAAIAALFTAAEVLRGFSPHLFLPLGSVAFGAVSPQLLPVAFLLGVPGLTLFVLLVNGFVALPTVCGGGPARRQALAALGGLGGILATCHAVAALVPDAVITYPGADRGNLCAVADHTRRYRPRGGYLEPETIGTIVARARDGLGCGFVAFPEVSAFVSRSAVAATDARQPIVLAGVRMVDDIVNGAPFVRSHSTNSICVLALAGKIARCVTKVDKRFLTPFVEAELFHGVPGLQRFGTWLTTMVTGEGNTEIAETRGNVLAVAAGQAVGILVCLEVFLPWQPARDEVGRRVAVPLIVVPVDHSYFPPFELIRELKRRAAALQAAAARTPLLLVSTEEVALFSSHGRALPPTRRKGEIAAWAVAAGIAEE